MEAFPGLDRECVSGSVFTEILDCWCFGESILDTFGTNRCKKSEWLKTGLQLAAAGFGNGGVGPLKQNK